MKLKMKKIAFILSLFAFTFTACSKDNEKNNDPDPEDGKVEAFGELTAEIQSDESSFTHKTTFKMSQMIGREGGLYELYIMAADDDKRGSIVIKAMVSGKGTYKFKHRPSAEEPYGDISYIDEKLNNYYVDASSRATGDCELIITEFPDKLAPAKAQKIKATFSGSLYDTDGKSLKIRSGKLDGYITSWD